MTDDKVKKHFGLGGGYVDRDEAVAANIDELRSMTRPGNVRQRTQAGTETFMPLSLREAGGDQHVIADWYVRSTKMLEEALSERDAARAEVERLKAEPVCSRCKNTRLWGISSLAEGVCVHCRNADAARAERDVAEQLKAAWEENSDEWQKLCSETEAERDQARAALGSVVAYHEGRVERAEAELDAARQENAALRELLREAAEDVRWVAEEFDNGRALELVKRIDAALGRGMGIVSSYTAGLPKPPSPGEPAKRPTPEDE